jgi:hypothetical protein
MCVLSPRFRRNPRRRGRYQARDGVIRHQRRDALARMRPIGPEPVSGPIERAEERARRDQDVRHAQHTAPDSGGNQRPDAALVPVPLRDDGAPEAGRQRIDFDMGRRSFEVVHEAAHMRGSEPLQACRERTGGSPRLAQRLEEPVERTVLAEEQDFVLAAEVVIQVAGRQVRGAGDVPHAGGGEAVGPENAGGCAKDLDAPRVRAPANPVGTGAPAD